MSDETRVGSPPAEMPARSNEAPKVGKRGAYPFDMGDVENDYGDRDSLPTIGSALAAGIAAPVRVPSRPRRGRRAR